MTELELIRPQWAGRPCIVAAPGPSLSPEVIRHCRIARMVEGWKILAVQDAYKALPYADAMYGCNPEWWLWHKSCDGFCGQKWTSHESNSSHCNEKLAVNDKLGQSIADAYGLRVCGGTSGDEFSFDPAFIRYGSNSGFQAINLALLFGCTWIVLVGFDMRYVGSKSHFFGDHPAELMQIKDEQYRNFIPRFTIAARKLPSDITIINATPESAMTCFPMMTLEDAIRGVVFRPNGHREMSYGC